MGCGKETCQSALDRWLGNRENPETFSMGNSRDTAVPEDPSESSNIKRGHKRHLQDLRESLQNYSEIPFTISCIELTMKHDRIGDVIDWMIGEPREDHWDGSRDNQEKALEDHASKRGWMF